MGCKKILRMKGIWIMDMDSIWVGKKLLINYKVSLIYCFVILFFLLKI